MTSAKTQKNKKKKKSSDKQQISPKKIFSLLEDLKTGNITSVENFLKSFLPGVDSVPNKARKVAEDYSNKNKLTATPAEKAVIKILRRLKVIYKFQEPLFYGKDKSNFYIMDFYIPEKRMCIEIDGEYHFTDEQQIKDVKRTEVINNKSIEVVRFKNEEVFKEGFAEILLNVIKPRRLTL